ncbi:uncharacterized protein [Dendrobates tinctorius]|uniref:uncharacterized protein n=1 Tax=Dendrobates tinctorius TaxID=92724 RepID=UPI003CCA25D6
MYEIYKKEILQNDKSNHMDYSRDGVTTCLKRVDSRNGVSVQESGSYTRLSALSSCSVSASSLTHSPSDLRNYFSHFGAYTLQTNSGNSSYTVCLLCEQPEAICRIVRDLAAAACLPPSPRNRNLQIRNQAGHPPKSNLIKRPKRTICSTAVPQEAEVPEPSCQETSQQTGTEDEPQSMDSSTVAPVVSSRLQAQHGRKRSSAKDEVDAIIVDGLQRLEDLCHSEHRDIRREIKDLQSRESVYTANDWKLLFLSYVPIVQSIPPHRNLLCRQRFNDLVEEFLAPQ